MPELTLFDGYVDSLLEIEHDTARKASGPLRKPFRRVLALLIATWPGDDASDDAKRSALRRLNTEALLAPMDAVEAAILSGATEALSQGIDAGAGMALVSATPFKRTVDAALEQAARYVRVAARQQVDRGTALLRQAQTLEQAQTALIAASPIPRVERVARHVTNKASNDGIELVAASDTALVLVWRAERDACVHCLAYQGHSPVRGKYPRNLTFGAKPLKQPGAVRQPPLHPNCRCTQWVIHKDVAEPVRVALLREAKRSILRGWSVESESDKVRVDAAKRLLAKPNGLPKSVQDYARTAVKRGEFKRGRVFPGAR